MHPMGWRRSRAGRPDRNSCPGHRAFEEYFAGYRQDAALILKPRGVGIVIKGTHHCITARGVHKSDTDLVTSRMLGCFRTNSLTRQEFLTMVD
jgi:hypothetical protein